MTLSGTTSDGTAFSSAVGSCSRLSVTHTNPTLSACIPTSSLAVKLRRMAATSSPRTERVLELRHEGHSGGDHRRQHQHFHATPSVRIPARQPATGQTVCVANNTDVYLITGTTALAPQLHKHIHGFARLLPTAGRDQRFDKPSVIAWPRPQPFQQRTPVSDLIPIPSERQFPRREVSEDISIDPPGYILSPNETSNTTSSLYKRRAVKEFTNQIAPGGVLTRRRNCSTVCAGIDRSQSNVEMIDLTQLLSRAAPHLSAPHQLVTCRAFFSAEPPASPWPSTSHLRM